LNFLAAMAAFATRKLKSSRVLFSFPSKRICPCLLKDHVEIKRILPRLLGTGVFEPLIRRHVHRGNFLELCIRWPTKSPTLSLPFPNLICIWKMLKRSPVVHTEERSVEFGVVNFQ